MAASVRNLPSEFLERLKRIVPTRKYHQVLDTFVKDRATCFRINPFKANPADIRTELKRSGIHLNPVRWYRLAYWIHGRDKATLFKTSAYRNGQIYVQNLSSMVPPLVLDPQPGEHILDLTAAPGSKTLQMATLMQNTGEIIAIEKSRNRYFRLLKNLKQQGVRNVTALNRNGERIWRDWPEAFDRVLLDTPCSTEGRFRADDVHTYRHWNLNTSRVLSKIQKRLLFSAIQALKVGGTLAYSTCAFAPEENEAIIDHALNKFGNALETIPIELQFENTQPALSGWDGHVYHAGVRYTRRILPTPTMEGFFIASLRKRAPTR